VQEAAGPGSAKISMAFKLQGAASYVGGVRCASARTTPATLEDDGGPLPCVGVGQPFTLKRYFFEPTMADDLVTRVLLRG
jgi:hypothetical protein